MDGVIQQAICKDLGMSDTFDVAHEADRRVAFLMKFLRDSNLKTFVLGISGGIDSTTSGLLAQSACKRLRDEGYDAKFIAVRLPYGVQRDEDEAMLAINTINPDELRVVNIKMATDGMMEAIYGQDAFNHDAEKDFVKGNIKARQRMIAQYAIAGATNGAVIGTDHAAEALMGFFTKFGDGACDLTPLTGLNKRRVRALGAYLGAPDSLVYKTPTADLEDLDPGKPDETSYGVSYDVLDDYLECKVVTPEQEAIILAQYFKTSHKRILPVTP